MSNEAKKIARDYLFPKIVDDKLLADWMHPDIARLATLLVRYGAEQRFKEHIHLCIPCYNVTFYGGQLCTRGADLENTRLSAKETK